MKNSVELHALVNKLAFEIEYVITFVICKYVTFPLPELELVHLSHTNIHSLPLYFFSRSISTIIAYHPSD